MTQPLHSLLSGTEVHARSLRWEIVGMLQQGEQTLVRFRGIEGAMQNAMIAVGGCANNGHVERSQTSTDMVLER